MRPAVDDQNLFLVGDTYPNHRNMPTEQDDTGHRENDKDAKPGRVRPRDDMRNTIDKKESNFFGIKPCFLARHSEDSSITTPTDDKGNAAENVNGRSSNIFSRHQWSSCFTTEQGYQVTYPFQAPSFHSESSKVSVNAQGPNLHGSFDPNPAVWDQPVPARPLLSLPCNGSEHLQTLSCDDPRIIAIAPHALINGDSPLAQAPLLPQQRKVKDQPTDPEVQRERNSDFEVINGNPACLSDTTAVAQGLISPEMEISALPQAAMNTNLIWETGTHADQDTAYQKPLGVLNDVSLADPERRVAEASFPVETTLKEREVREKAMKEEERKKKEERTRKEQQARERGEREVTEARGMEHSNLTEEGSSTINGDEALEQMMMLGTSRLERKYREREKEWMKKMGWAPKERSQDRQTQCCKCCILKDDSSHCDECNFCINKGLEGRHNRRPNSGPDECCICLEDMFDDDVRIQPCLHKFHRECIIKLKQSGDHRCPLCRLHLYSQTNDSE